MGRRRWESWMDQVLIERYANESNASLAAELGCTEKTILFHSSKLGLRKSMDYLRELYHGIAVKCRNGDRLNTKDAIEKRTKTMRKIYETDIIRIKWGLEQKTKRHFRLEAIERRVQRNRLKRLGYIVDNERLVAYWTENTHRATRLEKLKRGEKKGSIKCWYDFAELKEKL